MEFRCGHVYPSGGKGEISEGQNSSSVKVLGGRISAIGQCAFDSQVLSQILLSASFVSVYVELALNTRNMQQRWREWGGG